MQQQIYNNMENSQFPFASMVAGKIVGNILEQAQKQIALLQFAKKNKPGWIIHSQQGILDSNFQHFSNAPASSPSKVDYQPAHIVQDTLMNTGVNQNLVPTVFIGKNGSIYDPSIKSARKSKHSNVTILSKASSKLGSKGQILQKFKSLSKEQLDSDDLYSDKLRQYKIEEQKIMETNRVPQRSKAVCKLNKGEAIVFDYDGNFSKRKQNKAKQFPSGAVNLSPSKDTTELKNRSISQQLPSKKIEVVYPDRILKKQKSIQNEDRQIIFDTKNKKEQIMRSIEIKNQGIKITVDGEIVKKDRSLTEKVQNSRATYKVKTVEMRNVDMQNRNRQQRFKTQARADSSIKSNRDLPSTIRLSKQRARIDTEVSHYSMSKTQKISVQNYLLHKMVLDHDQDLDYKYIRIPSKQSLKQRVKTNIETQSLKYSEMDGLKIKQKLMSFSKEGDKLPKILSHHRQAEAQILKQIRRKNFA